MGSGVIQKDDVKVLNSSDSNSERKDVKIKNALRPSI